jgi:hypothetical protein
MEILADVLVEAVNDSRCEGDCGDQRSHRWCEMNATGGVK